MESRSTVTIRDIAKHLGISHSTVSAVMTGRRNRNFVSAKTRQRVLEAAEQMGYSRDRIRARRPQLRRIAVFCATGGVLSYPGGPLPTTALETAELLNKFGLGATVHVSADRIEASQAACELYRRHEADAAIFVGTRSAPPEGSVGDLPYVVIGEAPDDGMQAWQAGIDNEAAARTIGEHLWSLGHRHVGMIYLGGPLPGPQDERSARAGALTGPKRLRGLRAVWEARGHEFPDHCVLYVDSYSEEHMRAALPEFLAQANRRGSPLTALYAFNDWMAMMVMSVLADSGVRVPDDMSVVGFDNLPQARFVRPALTTVEQPFSELAVLAVTLLRERLQDPSQPPRVLKLACPLIVRESTAAPK